MSDSDAPMVTGSRFVVGQPISLSTAVLRTPSALCFARAGFIVFHHDVSGVWRRNVTQSVIHVQILKHLM